MKSAVINEPSAVALASNKLSFFTHITEMGFDVNIPEYTTDKNVASLWAESGKVVVGRTKLQGSGGEDIYLMEDVDSFNAAPHKNIKLYVKYIPKKDEYRVHIFGNKIVDIRRKALNPNFPKHMVNWKIRNHSKGFLFVKRDKPVDKDVYIQAMAAVRACSLEFGAVDVIWSNFHKKAFVLEINTAPGLEGSSIDNYKKAIAEYYAEFKEGGHKKPALKMKDFYDNFAKPVFQQEWGIEELLGNGAKPKAAKAKVLFNQPNVGIVVGDEEAVPNINIVD